MKCLFTNKLEIQIWNRKINRKILENNGYDFYNNFIDEFIDDYLLENNDSSEIIEFFKLNQF